MERDCKKRWQEMGMTEERDSHAIHIYEANLEIYRQKYGMFRHLDTLRWQIPTFTLGTGSLLLAFASEPNQPPAKWSFFVFSLLALFSSFAVFRIRKGICIRDLAPFRLCE